MGGFYYISYYDTVIGYDEIVAFYEAEAVTNFGKVYQYDPLGLLGRWGYESTVGYAANMFTASSSGTLKAVGFYVVHLNTGYDIEIYTGCSADAPRSGALRATQSGVAANAGFYTIRLNSPVDLAANDRFSVVVRFAASSVTSPIPVELAKEGHASKATASPGESFISPDGVAWTDTTARDKTANVCLKAYGGLSPLQLDIKANGSDGPITVTPADAVSIKISLIPGYKAGQAAD